VYALVANAANITAGLLQGLLSVAVDSAAHTMLSTSWCCCCLVLMICWHLQYMQWLLV
jgi:hypothetical protein